MKNISVLPDHKLSLQMHYQRSEDWVIVKGMAYAEVNNQQFVLSFGESIFQGRENTFV
jgi:mannose-1-phosphate guanylyltransferase/mannose-6-phosphate isomerase